MDADFFAEADDASEIVTASLTSPDVKYIGVFSMRGKKGTVPVSLPDGCYVNEINGSEVIVREGKLHNDGEPMIFRAK